MKMKNVLMILISLAVVFAMVGVVSAANSIYGQATESTNIQHNSNNPNGQATGSTYIQYYVAENYTVTIPSAVTFSSNLIGSVKVAASGVLIADGKQLNVTMKSTNGYGTSFNLTYGTPASSIPYTITVGNDLVTMSPYLVLTVPAGTTDRDVDLTFATTEEDIAKATKSGSHTDTLTFTCEVGLLTP